jgi:hypothetical protein
MSDGNIIKNLLEVVNLYDTFIKGGNEEEIKEINILLENITNKLEMSFFNRIALKIKEYKQIEALQDIINNNEKMI